MATVRLTRGTAFSRRLFSSRDLSAVDITYVLDDSTGTRTVWKWRPGGTSSSAFTWEPATAPPAGRPSLRTGALLFELTSTQTATLAAVGSATLSIFDGDPTTDQRPLQRVELGVEDLPGGAAPVT